MDADEVVRRALRVSRAPFSIEWSNSAQSYVCQRCKRQSVDASLILHKADCSYGHWLAGIKLLQDEA